MMKIKLFYNNQPYQNILTKQKHGVETTPQTFIEEKRVGGYDELRKYFGKGEAGQNGTTYAPVIAIFSVAALLSLAFQFFVSEDFISIRTLVLFIAFSMTLLAVQKLKDLYSFTNSLSSSHSEETP